jgi:hypothetical protein
MFSRISFAERLRDRSRKPGEAIVLRPCAGLEADSPNQSSKRNYEVDSPKSKKFFKDRASINSKRLFFAHN